MYFEGKKYFSNKTLHKNDFIRFSVINQQNINCITIIVKTAKTPVLKRKCYFLYEKKCINNCKNTQTPDDTEQK